MCIFHNSWFTNHITFSSLQVENIEIKEGCRLPVHMHKNEWRKLHFFFQFYLYFLFFFLI